MNTMITRSFIGFAAFFVIATTGFTAHFDTFGFAWFFLYFETFFAALETTGAGATVGTFFVVATTGFAGCFGAVEGSCSGTG
jgi:hypothetical protein